MAYVAAGLVGATSSITWSKYATELFHLKMECELSVKTKNGNFT
ncbi:hypothetical protein HanHA300_Chr14g0511041 [Helianthus annuus]|nr:hypothetical protein HanHA300_Chr14g0511041 [Helianthus annuus]KAJ0466880.1 hypothetical protein HanIR_Chr14g0677041 [Helianthus annuus]